MSRRLYTFIEHSMAAGPGKESFAISRQKDTMPTLQHSLVIAQQMGALELYTGTASTPSSLTHSYTHRKEKLNHGQFSHRAV